MCWIKLIQNGPGNPPPSNYYGLDGIFKARLWNYSEHKCSEILGILVTPLVLYIFSGLCQLNRSGKGLESDRDFPKHLWAHGKLIVFPLVR